jgi:hypothetical protein
MIHIRDTSSIMSPHWNSTCESSVTVSKCILTLLVGTLMKLTGVEYENIKCSGVKAKCEFARNLGARKMFPLYACTHTVDLAAASGKSRVRDLRDNYIIHYDLYANLKRHIQFRVVIA